MKSTGPADDYYVVLGVQPDALHDEVKASYRRLALMHHPDKNHGCKKATAMTQRINAAWEVLGDEVKRNEYDRTRPQAGAPTTDSPKPRHTARPGPWHRPTPPPHPSRPNGNPSKPRRQPEPGAKGPPPTGWHRRSPTPTEPDTTAPGDRSAEARSNAERRKWLNFEQKQEERIVESQDLIKSFQTQINVLLIKIMEDKATLANGVVYAREASSYSSKKLSEREKENLQTECTRARLTVEIMKLRLERLKYTNWYLADTLAKRRHQEDRRLADEKLTQEKREQAEKAEAAERVREEARKRTESERARARAEAEAAAHKERQQAEEQARKTSNRKLWEEPQEKREAAGTARQWRYAEGGAEASQYCKHKGWWEKVAGRRKCVYCTKTVSKFSQQCPSCNIMSCDACRRVLQAGGTPWRPEF